MPNSQKIARCFASSFGIGFSPILPGTLGSLAGLSVYLFVSGSLFVYLLVVGILSGLGLFASHLALQTTQEKDPSWIVMDEVVGMIVSLFQIPPRIPLLVIGFALFRFFDSVKTFPLNRLEAVKGEWGVFLDDMGAGVYTALCLHLILKFTS